MTSRGQCPRGVCACECLHPPLSGNPVSAPACGSLLLIAIQTLKHPSNVRALLQLYNKLEFIRAIKYKNNSSKSLYYNIGPNA